MKKLLIILFLFMAVSCEKEQELKPSDYTAPVTIEGIHLVSIADVVDNTFITYVNGYVIQVDQISPAICKGQILELNFSTLNYVILND